MSHLTIQRWLFLFCNYYGKNIRNVCCLFRSVHMFLKLHSVLMHFQLLVTKICNTVCDVTVCRITWSLTLTHCCNKLENVWLFFDPFDEKKNIIKYKLANTLRRVCPGFTIAIFYTCLYRLDVFLFDICNFCSPLSWFRFCFVLYSSAWTDTNNKPCLARKRSTHGRAAKVQASLH